MSSIHTVEQGECLSKIAHNYGFADYRVIYDDPANAELKKLRGSPDVLHPGDRLVIPDKKKQEVSVITDKLHEFVLRRKRVFLELAVRVDNQPVANAAFSLTVGGKSQTGKTNGEGILSVEIDTSPDKGHLRISDPPLEWDLEIGHINPANEVSGQQARLNNLGHPCGKADGVTGPRSRAAVRQFQFRNGLKPTGAVDGPTRSALIKAHEGGG